MTLKLNHTHCARRIFQKILQSITKNVDWMEKWAMCILAMGLVISAMLQIFTNIWWFIKQTFISMVLVLLLNKRLWDKCFTVNFVKILRIPFFLEHNPVAACVQLYRIWITQRHSSIFFFSGRTYKYKKITQKLIKAFKPFLRKLHLKINKSLRTFLTHPSSVALLQILFDHFKREI